MRKTKQRAYFPNQLLILALYASLKIAFTCVLFYILSYTGLYLILTSVTINCGFCVEEVCVFSFHRKSDGRVSQTSNALESTHLTHSLLLSPLSALLKVRDTVLFFPSLTSLFPPGVTISGCSLGSFVQRLFHHTDYRLSLFDFTQISLSPSLLHSSLILFNSAAKIFLFLHSVPVFLLKGECHLRGMYCPWQAVVISAVKSHLGSTRVGACFIN